MNKQDLIGTNELANMYDISKQAVDKWRKRGCPHIKLSDRVFVYDVTDVNDWLSENGSLRAIK